VIVLSSTAISERAVSEGQRQAEGVVAPGARGDVCMIAYTFYAFDARVRREAETLVARGYRVRFLTPRAGAKAGRFSMNGVEVRELPVAKYRGKSRLAYLASYVWFALAASAVCLSLVIRRQIDVVHVHNLPDFLVVAAILPRLAGSKVVLDVHDSIPETFATKFSSSSIFWKALCLEERLSALVAHRVICVNHPQREAMVARGIPHSKTFISMNVPDPAIFGDAAYGAPAHDVDSSFNLVYHGTMSERLGVDVIIRAFARLRDRVPMARLHLWGAGDDAESFRRLVRELNLDEHVTLNMKGFPLQELPRLLSSMHVGVVGNRRSAAADLMLPVKLLEYISLGIPAVVPRLRTIEHYFSDDMVLYYDAEDVDSMASAIHRLYCQPELRREQAVRARAFLAQYGWERQGPELAALYTSLLSR
jgi:glycosyltransferase involved in cell wall biosynthesis